MTHFFTKYIHIHYINALNEPPVYYLDKKLNPPVLPDTQHRKFYDVIIL